MKYNILTVINEGYAAFGKLFINSLFENVNLRNVSAIYIYDTGLSPETVTYFNYFPKVQVVKTGSDFKSAAIHDEGWAANTYSKTAYLLDTLEKTGLPTLMIDSDCIFASTFEDVLDFNADIIACTRDRQGFSKHIGSFFGAMNVEKAKAFLGAWINNISYLQAHTDLKHCESPALTKTIGENPAYRVQEAPEQIVSAVFPDLSSRIYHLKSDYYAVTIEQRLKLPHAAAFCKRYL
tara:strand:- start:8208 stop:8915 length:708 start_codon:yes stop_codon:yes gene_type:complete